MHAQRIEAWFAANARDLPWRHQRTPWTALVSEIMLQQTQAARVAERYPALIAEFPTPQAMADAPVERLLEHWQGLGYYRRARSLHAAACMIVEQFHGETPTHVDDLLQLPGIGRYSAGSIASIAGGHRAPIVDGNVRRVLARLNADDAANGDKALDERCWARADALVRAAADPGAFNEGLMEFGATVCTPKRPHCDTCPLANHCAAHTAGTPEAFPRPKPAKPVPVEHVHALLLQRGDQVLLEQCPEGERWAGMWHPLMHVTSEPLPMAHAKAAFDVPKVKHIEHFTHTLTHRRLEVQVFQAMAPKGRRIANTTRKWCDPANPCVPVSSLGRKILDAAVPT